jgi:hypothetical protein
VAYKDPERKKAAQKAYRERNRELIAARAKARRKLNPEKRNREKERAYAKAYRERNPDKVKAAYKAWCKANREQKAAADKAWREANREKVAAVHKAWLERNEDRVRKNKNAWRKKNQEKAYASTKKWVNNNREKHNLYRKKWYRSETGRISAAQKHRNRRARENKAFVHLTKNEKERIVLLENTRLELQKETGQVYHIDHILPLAHGGIHHPINMRILGINENSSKNDKLLPEAIALAPEHFRLYSERVSPERAWEFVRQLAEGLGLGEDDLDALIMGKPMKNKSTLEDFME